MKKNILIVTFALLAGYCVYHSQKKEQMSETVMANVEALANDENGVNDRLYETKRESTIEIWDDASGTYKKMICTECEGKGTLTC